ncbi:uncharacterized protein LY79DRAFT_573956 [Colletotrichum navitas]|uniref:Uncharacterized protein n=1 Tax=Colletotrichum navitas TaxID=681940 RepID=A0AAD8PJC8_9PEZI|nr:uncharacterized protein LY79DRAFT_573956 [Colletotrichum navitas]KAK1561703.1 hypothetical protein LY79DRAFT_573956 [Colletotrichum navitas]
MHMARYARWAIYKAAWKLCKALCIFIPVMLGVALVHVETGEWLGPRYNRAVGVAAGWVGAVVGGVFSSWTPPSPEGGSWHLPLVPTDSTSSTTSAHHTFNMPVPSELGMVIPKSVHRDLEDLYETLGGGSGSKEHSGGGMLKHSRETLQAADELDDHAMAYYDLTRRQVERTKDKLQTLRGRGSMYSGVRESCRAEPPAVWRALLMWWRGARVAATRSDVMVIKLNELRELLHRRRQDMGAARHHPSGGGLDRLSRVVEGSCHYAKAAREYVGLQIGSGGVEERIEEGSESRTGKRTESASVSKVSEAATGLQAVCVATRWSKERHEELVGQILHEAKLLDRTIIDVNHLRDKVRRTYPYARDEAEVEVAGNGKARGRWCEQEEALVAEVEAEMETLIAKYLKTLQGYFGRAYD